MNLSHIAKPYASAVFLTASKNNTLDAWSALLSAGRILMADKTILDIVDAAKIEKSVKKQSINNILSKMMGKALPDEQQRFINLLVDNHRLPVLPDIEVLFTELKEYCNQSKVLYIDSAYELSADELADLSNKLSKKHKMPVELIVAVKPTLLAGIVIREDDKVTDASISAKFEEFKSFLLKK